MINYYQILNIENFATIDCVKKAFKLLTYQFSINLTLENQDFYAKAQKSLNIAYKTLCSPKNKIIYDEKLRKILGIENDENNLLKSKIKQLEKEKVQLFSKLADQEYKLQELEIRLGQEVERTKSLNELVNKTIRKGFKRLRKGFLRMN